MYAPAILDERIYFLDGKEGGGIQLPLLEGASSLKGGLVVMVDVWRGGSWWVRYRPWGAAIGKSQDESKQKD